MKTSLLKKLDSLDALVIYGDNPIFLSKLKKKIKKNYKLKLISLDKNENVYKNLKKILNENPLTNIEIVNSYDIEDLEFKNVKELKIENWTK